MLDLIGQDSITVDDNSLPTLHDLFNDIRSEVQNNAAPTTSDSGIM